MRTDPAGVEHPTHGDIPTDEGYLHIANCPQCVCDFDGPVLWFAREVKARHDSRPNRERLILDNQPPMDSKGGV